MEVTVMTFNLRMDTLEDGKDAWIYRREHVVETIKDNNPDIIGTQEGLYHMVQYLEDSLQGYSMFGEGRDGGKQGEYNAIFYKKSILSLLNQGQFWLSETPDIPGSKHWDSGCTRICTWANFAYDSDPFRMFTVFNTHLDNASQWARKRGVELVTSKIKSSLQENIPVLLTGDFNCEPEDEVIRHIEKFGLQKIPTDNGTYHEFEGGQGKAWIDHIFVSTHSEVIRGSVDRRNFNGSYPSDHYPVIGKVNINET